MRPRAAVASVQGTVSVGRIDSSQWNGIVTPPVGVSEVPTIEQTCIQRVEGSEDWRWSNRERWRERFLLVTGNTKAWRNATQTNIANKLPIQFSHAENIAVRRNDPASTFHQTFPSVLSTLLCLWQPAPSFPPFFFILNEGGEREFGDSRILRGKVSSVPWRGREILFSWEKWSDFGE